MQPNLQNRSQTAEFKLLASIAVAANLYGFPGKKQVFYCETFRMSSLILNHSLYLKTINTTFN